MITARHLSKSFGSTKVFEGLNFDIHDGQLHALVGRNGCGKTTLLSLLAGQKRYEGELSHNPYNNRAVMDTIVFTGVDTAYPNWRFHDILTAAGQRYPYWSLRDDLLDAFDLDLHTSYAAASRGQRSMLAIIVALSANAELTLLDEPYLGLDDANRTIFYDNLPHDRTMVVATHVLEESAQHFDRFLLMGEGMQDYSAAELDDAFVVAPGSPDLAPHAVRTEEIAGQSRMVVPRGVADGTPLPLADAVRILGGQR